MAFPPGFLDELRARLSLADLVGRRVRLVRRGREHSGLCPFHNEKTPSFYVVEDKGFFHCFGCGAHGDAIGYVMRAENLDFIEAVERLAGEAGLQVPQQTPIERERAQRQKTLLEALAAAAEFYENQLWAPGGIRAREYLARRGLDEETIRRFRLGWAPDDRQALRRALGGDFPEALLHEAGLVRVPEDNGTPYDYFRGRVIFPIGDRAGRVIAFGGRTMGDDQPKYLNSPDTPVFEKGRVLYGWALARANLGRDGDTGGQGVIVAEGYMDVIALHRAGLGGAVAPLGTALTETQLHELWRLAPEPTLCFDGDSAGQRAALRALNRALPLLQPGRSLRFATLPPGEDPDSLIRAGGPSAFSQVLAAARPLSEVLWQTELSAGPVDTPERRADFERRLMAQAGLILDRTVQVEYRRFLRDRLFTAGRPTRRDFRLPKARRFERGGVQPKDVTYTVLPGIVREHLASQSPPPPPRDPGRVHREFLLFLLMQHPFLIEEKREEAIEFDFPEPDLARLKTAILQIEDLPAGLDAGAVRQHLGEGGFTATVDAIFSSSRMHAAALLGGSDPDQVRRGWSHIVGMMRRGENRAELASAAEELARSFSPEALARFHALSTQERPEDLPDDGGTAADFGRLTG
jgi:DNA primase